MKKFCLIILFVFLLPVTNSFAVTPLDTETGQEIYIPYATIGNGLVVRGGRPQPIRQCRGIFHRRIQRRRRMGAGEFVFRRRPTL